MTPSTNPELRNIRGYLTQKIKEVDGLLKQKQVDSVTAAAFLKTKKELIDSRTKLVSKYKIQKQSVLKAQCQKTLEDLGNEKIIQGLTAFKDVPLTLQEIIELKVKKARKKKL